jgi:hypothetical protein
MFFTKPNYASGATPAQRGLPFAVQKLVGRRQQKTMRARQNAGSRRQLVQAWLTQPDEWFTGRKYIMTTLPKICLTISAAGFAAGSIVDFGGFSVNPAWLIALPLGAIFFGAFLIALMLEKEMAQFDAEQAEKFERAHRNGAGDAKCNNCGNCNCQPGAKIIPATAG